MDVAAATDRLDALLADIQSYWPVPGGVVAIVDRVDTLLTRPFGLADREAGIPVTGGELFEIGSISKVATATVIHQLIDEGRFGLETPIVDLLPWFAFVADGRAAGAATRITIRSLLQHSAGLISGSDAMPDELAQALLASRSAQAPVGEHFHYSNLGYILLSLAAAAATGRTLAQLVSTRVLHPLGMTDAIAVVRHEHRPRLARGYGPVHDDRPWLPGDPLAAATWLEVAGGDGNIAATAADMARFARMLLGAGELSGARVLSPAAFERLISVLAPGGEGTVQLAGCAPADDSRYGLGINVERHGERTVLTHGGGMVGYASFVWADVTEGLGVVVLTNANGDSPVAEAIARAVASWAGERGAPTRLNPAVWRAAGIRSGVPQSGAVATAADEARPRVIEPAMLGTFVGRDAGGREFALTIRSAPRSGVDREDAAARDGDANATLAIDCGGVTSPLYWGWGARVATTHPEFRMFAFEFESRDGRSAWIWGDVECMPADPAPPGARDTAPRSLSPAPGAYVGHYRSYSPWFPSFRVVLRAGRLVLIAATGVEAPAEDVALVELEPGVFRIGAEEWLPERLRFGPIVDGRAAWCDRDGCLYSRAFTD